MKSTATARPSTSPPQQRLDFAQENKESSLAVPPQPFVRNHKNEPNYESSQRHTILAMASRNPSAFAVGLCLTLSIVLWQPVFLYGILAVLVSRVSGIIWKWAGYVWDDPELHFLLKFLGGWGDFAVHHGQRLLHRDERLRKRIPFLRKHAKPGIDGPVVWP